MSIFWTLSTFKARIGQLFPLFVIGRSATPMGSESRRVAIVTGAAVSLCKIFEVVSSPASTGLFSSSSNLATPLIAGR